MKRIIFFILSAFVFLMASCSGDDGDMAEQGNCSLSIRVSVDPDTDDTQTRATSLDPTTYTLIIENTAGYRKEMLFPTNGLVEGIPDGEYTITVTSHPSGMPAPAFDTQVYSGFSDVVLESGNNTDVTIVCTQANAGIFFVYDSSLETVGYNNIVPTVRQEAASLVYNGGNRKSRGYFAPGQVSLSLENNGLEILMDGKTEQEFELAAKQLLKITLFVDEEVVSIGDVGISVRVEPVTEYENEEVIVNPVTEVELIVAGDKLAEVTSQKHNTVTKLTVTGDIPASAWDELTEFKIVKSITLADFDGKIPNDVFSGGAWVSLLPESLVTFIANKATEIGDSSFEYANFKEVRMPEVKVIGEVAFQGCMQLESMYFPKVEKIKQAAFSQTNIKTLEFPMLKTVEYRVFGNSKMEHFSAPILEEMSESMLIFCTVLKTVNLPMVKTMGKTAMSHCRMIESIDMPLLETIGGSGISYCYELKSVNFPKLTTIPSNCFINCSKLEAIVAPEALSVGDSAFSGCTSLKSASLPKAETFGTYVFYKSGLIDASFPKVTGLKDSAFSECPSLVKVNMPEVMTLETGREFLNTATVKELFLGKVVDVPHYAFNNFISLETVELPKAKTFGHRAFGSNIKLTSVNLPEATTMAIGIFSGCSTLKSIELPKAATSQGNMFDNCAALEEVSLPSMTNIGVDEFNRCPSLKTIKYGTKGTISIEERSLYGCETTNVTLYLNSSGIEISDVSDNVWKGVTWKSVVGYQP